jgi:hypothetical protein
MKRERDNDDSGHGLDLDAADVPFPGLSALRETSPPPSLVPKVMQRIAEPRPFSLWAWLRRPRRLELRVTPLGLAVAGGLMAALAVVGLRTERDGVATATSTATSTTMTASGDRTTATTDQVMVRFVLVAKGAKQVSLAGDFNAWQPEATVLENADGQGTFVATVPLKRGAYEYMFLVDGRWVTDPSAAESRPDGFGRRNGVLRL